MASLGWPPEGSGGFTLEVEFVDNIVWIGRDTLVDVSSGAVWDWGIVDQQNRRPPPLQYARQLPVSLSP